jgi:hypothetical protein
MLKFVKTAALMLKDVKNQHLSLEVSIIFLYLCSAKVIIKPMFNPSPKERSRKPGGTTNYPEKHNIKICKS